MRQPPSISVNFKRPAPRECSTDHALARNLHVVTFKGDPGEVDQVIDLSDLASKRSELVGAYCLFLLTQGKKAAPSTREKLAQHFRYFLDFLDAYEVAFGVPVTKLSELTTVFTLGYADWLDGNRHIESSLKLSPGSKNIRYNVIKRFIRYCQSAQHSRDRISQSLAFRAPWKVGIQRARKQQALSLTDVKDLRKICKASIDVVRRDLTRTSRILLDSRIRVPDLYLTTSVIPYHNDDVLLKAAAQAFDINRLTGSFRSSMPGLARALRAPYGDIKSTISRLHFTTETLLPFILMIGLPLCFNEIGLVTLRRTNVKRGVGILGDERIFIIGLKARASRHQRRSFPIDAEDPYSPASLIETVVFHSERLRKHVEPRFSDTLFIAASTGGEPPGGYFSHKNTVYRSLDYALKKLLTAWKIPPFNLNDLRTIGADLAAFMSEGDMKVQQILLQHQSIKTTRDHYETQQAARARQEQLAHQMNERERWISSEGRIDPRNSGGSVGLYRAATPGLDCLDAMNSPISGQRSGTLCSAYAKCFRCPRCVFVPSVANSARLLQMHERFEEASVTMNRARWAVEWEAEHQMLRDFWLHIIPKQVLAEALTIDLPPVPSID